MKLSLLLVLSMLMLVSCAAHKTAKKEVEEEASQSKVTDPKALSGTIDQLITNSSTLKEEQKVELRKIMETNKQKATELSEKSYQYRGVLIKELLAGKADRKKIKILKKDIRKIENERLKNTFETVEKISRIVKSEANSSEYANQLLMMERPIR